MLQWNTGDWNHRAYWGENAIPWGRDGSGERRQFGPLPKKGEWVRLEVETTKVGLKPGMVINGWAFTQFGGTVYWDRAGIVTRTPQGKQPFHTLSAWLRVQRATGGRGPATDHPGHRQAAARQAQRATKEGAARLTSSRTPTRIRRRRSPHCGVRWRHWTRNARASIRRRRRRWCSRSRATPKPAYVLKRGEYDQRGEQVGRATPKFLPPLPDEGQPRSPRPGAVAVVCRASPDGPRRGQPSVAAVLRYRPGQDHRGFRHPGRIAQPSRIARLAGRAVPRRRLGRQEDDEAPGDVGDVPAIVARQRRIGWRRIRTIGCCRVGRATGSTPRCCAIRRCSSAASWSRSWAGRASSRRSRADCGRRSATPAATRGTFVPDRGHEKVHRRSMYTFWKRTAPPPEMNTFDAPSREVVHRAARADQHAAASAVVDE